MKNFNFFFIIFFSNLLAAEPLIAHIDKPQSPHVFSLSLLPGQAINILEFDYKDSNRPETYHFTEAKTEPLIHGGVNYDYFFTKNGFVDCSLNWLYYPTLLKPHQRITVHPVLGDYTIPAWSLLSVPLIDVTLNYKFDNNLTLGLGTTYLWGTSLLVRYPIANKWSLEIRGRWFFDRIAYFDGIHDIHVLAGLCYRF